MDSGASSLIGGLASGLDAYLGKQQDVAAQAANEQNQANKEIEVEKAKQAITHPPQPSVTMDRDLAEKALPGYGGKMVDDYNTQNPTNKLTLQQGLDYISKAKEVLDQNSPNQDKINNEQDKLEKQAMDRITMVRGDQSLMRAEHQRDAAGMAYDTLTKAESEKRPLTELEQTDLIGQLWQARTGKAPTDNDMKMLSEKTAKRGFNHVITYVTGSPSIVGASTDATLANIKQFVDSTGKKADQQWSAYMQPRLVKPTGLNQDRWDHIVSQQRGIPYGDQKNVSDKTYGTKAKAGTSLEDKKAALRAKLGI